MRAKTIVDLLSLSVSLYMLSKDEEFLKDAAEMAAKGKEKAGELYDALTGKDGSAESLLEKVTEHAARIKAEMLERADEIAVSVYNRMHIAHTNELKEISEQISQLKTELALAEARIVHLEGLKN